VINGNGGFHTPARFQLASLHHRHRAARLCFTVDEPVDALGEKLVLPEWFEPNRNAIEQKLPPITLKTVEKAN